VREYTDCVLVVDDGSQDETALLAQHADAPQAFDFFFSETGFLSIGNRSHWQLV
jgi:glycosyltransferase involved in cell wall biosynthesis